MTRLTWRDAIPEILLASAVVVLGLIEGSGNSHRAGPEVLVVLAIATAVGTSRRLPSLALALVWIVGLVQILGGFPVMLVQVGIIAVGFGTARWGAPATVWLSALSIPAAVAVCLNVGAFFPFDWRLNLQLLLQPVAQSGALTPVLALMGVAVLGVPWLAGLNLRFAAKAKDSHAALTRAEETAARVRREIGQINEISRLRNEQTRLARDVHDVVGHSLAVILAQAESGQYLNDDPEKLKQTMTTIATSARTSLQDVREVLSATQDDTRPTRTGELDHLIEGIRASGLEVVLTEVGTPRLLPSDLEVVVFRVVQEMLTNAVRHGRRDQPIQIERNWPDQSTNGTLRFVVLNVASSSEPGASGGHGLDGMRQRLEAAGGQIRTRRENRTEGPTFIATATIPIGAPDVTARE